MINAKIQEFKKQHKTIPIPELVKGTQELKKLHAELLTAQTQKQEWQAQIEPLQEWITTVLEKAKEARTQSTWTQQ